MERRQVRVHKVFVTDIEIGDRVLNLGTVRAVYSRDHVCLTIREGSHDEDFTFTRDTELYVE